MNPAALHLLEFTLSALRHGALVLGVPYEVHPLGKEAVVFVDCSLGGGE